MPWSMPDLFACSLTFRCWTANVSMDAIQAVLSVFLAGIAGLALYRLVFDVTLSSGRYLNIARGTS